MFYTLNTMHTAQVPKNLTDTHWPCPSEARPDPFTLECRADRLIRQTGAHVGDYPAYSERDLRRRAKLRGEICISELIAPGKNGRVGDVRSLLEKGLRLDGPRSRVKPGYDILLQILIYASDLTARQREVIDLTIAGHNAREISERIKVSQRAGVDIHPGPSNF